MFAHGGHGLIGHGYAGCFIVLGLTILLIPCVFGMVEEKMGLEVKWVFNTSDQFPGRTFGAGHWAGQTVWDVDGDGRKEVVFGTRRGDSKRLWCVEGDGSFQWIYPPIDEDGLPSYPEAKVSLVDVDNDGIYELCTNDISGRFHVVRGDGSVLWTWDSPIPRANLMVPPQALDVDDDGFVEFFIPSHGAKAYRVSHEGKLVWEVTLGNNNRGLTVCDLCQDGRYVVLVCGDSFQVHCLQADDGEELWSFDTGANIKPQSPIVTDIDGDGEFEILIWTDAPSSAVFVISSYGTEKYRWTHPREGVNIRLCQAMGDVDHDGSMDMALMTGDAAFCIDIGSNPPKTKWEVNFTQLGMDGIIPKGALNHHYTSYQLIADIDGDGEQEILWLAPYPIVTDGATGVIEGFYVNEHVALNTCQQNGAWWGDVDQDGVSEWICELNGNTWLQTLVYCLTMGGGFPANSYWPEYNHCAYPAEYQAQQDWILLKGAYSNSQWFPVPETPLQIIHALGLILLPAILHRKN